jgi:serine/threonine protein kinase
MTKIKHPNIVHCYDFLETGRNYYMILDLCDGDLEEHIEKEKSLSESEAIYFMKQIANGFRELNKWRIMHRDFKPANVMLKGDVIKIGDFGFAKMGATITNTGLGTPVTMAPELLNAKPGASYTDKIDLWSIGVVFYMMLYGNKGPFTFKKYTELQNAVETQSGKNLKFGKQQVSDEAKDLLRRLIEPNVDARIGWNDFFNHNLFKVQDKKEAAEDFVDLGRSVMCHGNKANVNLLFGRNRENRTGAIDKIAIDKIELDEIELHYNTKATKTQNA